MFSSKRSSLFLVLTMFCGIPVFAADAKPAATTKASANKKSAADTKPVTEAPEEESKSIEQHVIDTGAAVSDNVEALANRMDLMLAGKKYTENINESQINISQLVSYTEGGIIRNSTDFGLNLRLPNLEKRWQVRFSSYDEEEEDRDLSQKIVRTAPRQKQYGAGVQFFKKLGDIKTSFQPRLQLKNPLDVSYIIKFESEAKRKKYHLMPKFELLADSHKGVGEYLSMTFIASFTHRLEFSFMNEEEYHQLRNDFFTQHGVTLDHGLNDTQSVGVGASVSSENHPFSVRGYSFSTNFNQLFFGKILNMSFSPFLVFTRGERFKGKVGVSLNMAATF